MFWFVEGEISERRYMADKDRHVTHRTLVQAETEREAETKYREYWEKKTDEYSVYYSVLDVCVSETIL